MGQLVLMFEVLKSKGIITDADIAAKFKEMVDERERKAKEALEAERADLVRKAGEEDSVNVPFQSPIAGNDAGGGTDGGQPVLPKQGD